MSRFGKMLPAVLLMGALLLLPLLQGAARAAGNPDDLYGKGRYKEAEEAYRKLDMDHPSDLRYRYDRGCAAFQGGKLDEARAAFTSVARRARDDDMKYRALYNLGITAAKKNDFASARDSFKEALKIRPDDEDARHNLELALKELKREKESKEGQKQDNGQGKGSGQKDGGDREKGKDGRDKGDGKDRKGENGKDDQQGSQGMDQEQKGRDENSGRQPGQSSNAPAQREEKQDLSGELKGKNMGPGSDAKGAPQGMSPAAAMERKRAESLLDNTRENRTRARELKGRPGGNIPVGSGKEW